MAPLISVVMPVRNAAGTVKRAIDSIIHQTFKEFELIVIDDGSVDDTAAILNSYTDPRVLVVRQEHEGIAKSLNKGIKLAKGELIARMDADDIASPDRLRLQCDFLQKKPDIGVVGSGVKFLGDPQNQKGYFLYCKWINKLISSHDIYVNRFVDAPLAHPTVLFRKEITQNYGYYDESELPEDYELWLRWMEQGVKFSKINKELLIWTDHPHRLSRVHPNYNQEAFYKIKTKYLAKWITRRFPVKLPDIWIWGWGKTVFQKCSYLKTYGIPVYGYIDISHDHRKQKKRPVIHYSSLPAPENTLVLSYVGDRVGRAKIYQYLLSRGYVEGQNFYMMS